MINEVYEFLKKCGVWYIATVEGDQPHVRPFGAVNLYNNRIYIQTGKIKPVANQLKANPKIEISGMANGEWIRLKAKAILDEDLKAQEAMLEANPSLKKMYSVNDGNTEVYYLKDIVCDICSFTKEPRHFE